MQMFTNATYNFTRWRWYAIGFSLIVILAGVVVIVQRGGLPVGIDFSGGTIVVVKFDQTVSEDQIRGAVDPIPGEEVVQRYGEVADNQWLIRLAQSGIEQAAGLEQGSEQILGALRGAGLPTFEVLSREIVGPVIGEDLQRRGIYATLASILAITIYIGFRFRFSFAIGAIAATFHDLIVTTAVLVLFNYEVSLNIVAALLTITGYSVNDTIVIFDRVRENMRSMRRDSLDHVVNVSVNQTLARTVITAGTTFLSVLALYLFGGEALEGFAFTMLVGIVSGTYSTIFIASSIAIILGQRKGGSRAATVVPAAGKAEAQTRPGRKARGARAS